MLKIQQYKNLKLEKRGYNKCFADFVEWFVKEMLEEIFVEEMLRFIWSIFLKIGLK